MSSIEAKSILACLSKVINCITNRPTAILDELDLIGQDDQSMVHAWNKRTLLSIDSCVHTIVQNQASLSPEASAICSWDGNLSYKDLDHKSSRLALYLKTLGVVPGVIVPFCFHKSLLTVVAMLATLKAGGAPVALSPDLPLSRIEHILASTHARLVLMGFGLTNILEDQTMTKVVVDETLLSTLPDYNLKDSSSLTGTTPADIAFVQFTSGSTGVPKGIVLDHRAFCTSAMAQQKGQNINQHSRVLQFAAYSFDASLQEIFTTLIAGGTICIPSDDQRLEKLESFIEDAQVNWAFFTPTFCQTLQPTDVASLETLIVGGEAASEGFVRQWGGAVTLLNGYGPSECCICCSVNNLSIDSSSAKTIGRGLEGCKLWITRPGNHELLAPIGSVGELVVQGPILARGYLNDAKQTKTAFIECVPWLTETYGDGFNRVYKTGDLVRYRDDGAIEFIGRKDSQVKIRGQRVELRDIESHIQKRSQFGISAVVEVIDLLDGLMQQTLVAFQGPLQRDQPILGVINESHISDRLQHKTQCLVQEPAVLQTRDLRAPEPLEVSSELRIETFDLQERLTQALPSYMVPKLYIPLTYLPVNTSGKIDRKMIRSIAAKLSPTQISEYSLVQAKIGRSLSSSEETLRDLWAALLGIPPQEIGVEDSFFRLGDSINAIKLAAAGREHGFAITVADIFLHPRLEDQALLLKSSSGSDFFDLMPYSLITQRNAAIQSAMRQCLLGSEDIQDILPCTAMQKTNLFVEAAATGPQAAHLVFELQPGVNHAHFKASWLALAEQNSILRTRFIRESEDSWLQTVVSHVPEWSSWNDIDACLEDHKSFNMSYGDPTVHFGFVAEQQQAPECSNLTKSYFVLTMHCSLYDRLSISSLLARLRNNYYDRPQPEPTPYNGYIKYVSQVDGTALARFWTSSLEEPSYVHYPEPGLTRTQRFVSRTRISASMNFNKVKTDDIALGVRLAWIMVLSRRTDSEDVVFGTTVSGRDSSILGFEGFTGPTTATFPFRIHLSSSQTIESAVMLLQSQMTAMSQHSNITLEQVRALGYDCATGCNFSNVLKVQQDVEASILELLIERKQGNIKCWDEGFAQISLVLDCHLGFNGSDLALDLDFDENIVSSPEAKSLLGQVQVILQQLLSKPPETQLSEISHLSAFDFSQLAAWNDIVPLPVHDTAHGRIIKVCNEQPDAMAIDSWDGTVSFRELDGMTSSLASYLIKNCLPLSNGIVALCFEKSMWAIIAMLAVIRAGRAFLYLDPSHPSQRLQHMVDGVKVELILTSTRHSTKAASLASHHLVIDRGLFRNLEDPGYSSPAIDLLHVRPEDDLYCFFTSGSTGNPKGHVTTHQAYCSASSGHIKGIGFNSSSRIFQFASYTFDVSISDILTGLSAGACICVPSDDERLNDVTGSMARFGVTIANLTPTVAQLLNPDSLPELHTLLLGGEAIQQLDLDTWADRVVLKISYGPSECSPRSTINTRMLANADPRNIGRPCSCRCWIVHSSDHEQLQPVGVTGELVIEGPNVCSGYISAPDQASLAFIEAPTWFSSITPTIKPCGRFYKTGDLAFYDGDGNIIFAGRKDTQVKLRGQRIELGEVEVCVREALPQSILDNIVAEIVPAGGFVKVPSLVVFLQAQKEKERKLIDLSVNSLDAEIIRLREHLPTILPPAMVPKYYIYLHSVPMMSSGKMDRRALRQIPATLTTRQLGMSVTGNGVKSQPTSSKEHKLRKLWALVLSIGEEDIGMNDNFFHLGGDSISAIKLVSAARRDNLELTVGMIFEHPLLEDLAMVTTIDQKLDTPHEAQLVAELAELVSRECDVDIDRIEDVYPATPLQQGLIALTTRNHRTNTIQQVFHLESSVDVTHFAASWEILASHHIYIKDKRCKLKHSR